jgi:lipopolysaccharide heptosyltransferase II
MRMDRKRLLKKLDDMFGGLVVRLFPAAPHTVRVGEVRSILLIRPGGAGDAVLLIPTIHALQHAYPAARLDVLAEQRNYEAFPLAGLRGRIYRYDRLHELLAVVRRRYDMVVDSEQWYRLSAVVARLCRSPVRVGFATNGRRRLFTHPIPYQTGEYEADNFLRLAAVADDPQGVTFPFIRVPPEAVAWTSSLPAVQGGPYVVLFPGASLREKRWEPERFVEVARYLTDRQKRVVVVGGKAEAGVAETLANLTGAQNFAGQIDLSRTAAIIAGAEAVVSNDSVVLHLAAGLGVPTVALFGPTSIVKWAPSGDRHLTIAAGTSCAPCARYGTIPLCRAATGCMEGISVRQVIAALEQLLV